ncbi:MAG: prolipoprotein diacylglyceryl transferase [Clostridiales bacterium]|jgi:phosphatidylglycerol:prolipoprotein diacylglycerol transferase|nr:prolipoprotein diacylglyceryl transferase [Clostridiales bacterium]
MPDIWFHNIGLRFEEVSRSFRPVGGLLELFGVNVGELQGLLRAAANFEIYFYGLTLMLAVLVGQIFALREAKRSGQDTEKYMDFPFYVIICAIVGARLYYVLFSWDAYKDNLLKIFALREGGLGVYGGIYLCVAMSAVYAKAKKIPYRLFLDTTVPSLAIGQAIGRLGNFFNREAFGGFTDSLFAMRCKAEQVFFIPQEVAARIVTVQGVDYIQVHPAFLYEFALCVAVFVFFQIYKIHKKFDGEIFCLYLVLYGAGRALIESMRTDQLFLWGTGIPVSQLVSVLMIAAGLAEIFRQSAKRKKALPLEEPQWLEPVGNNDADEGADSVSGDGADQVADSVSSDDTYQVADSISGDNADQVADSISGDNADQVADSISGDDTYQVADSISGGNADQVADSISDNGDSDGADKGSPAPEGHGQ